MKDPYQAMWTLNAEIGICKSLLTIENSIKFNFFVLMLRSPVHVMMKQ